MNNTFKMMVDLLLNDITSNPNSVHTEAAKKYLNQSYFTICASKKIEALSRTVNLSPSSGVLILPSDCVPDNIESLVDENDHQYYRDESRGRGGSYYAYNYYIDGLSAQIASTDTGSIESNSTTLTTEEAIFTSDCVGEYVSIGDTAGLYLIDSFTSATEVELEEPYRGDDVSSGHIVVRPNPTYNVKFKNDQGTQLYPTTITLTYQKLPLPLYNDYDVLLNPGSGDDIRAMALQSMLRRLGKGREARMMSDEVRIERSLAAKDGSKKRYPLRARKFFRRPESTTLEDYSQWQQ